MELIQTLAEPSEDSRVGELAQLRELIWQTQRNSDLAKQHAKTVQAKADALRLRQRQLQDSLKYMENESKILVDYKGLYEKMDLVDVSEFKAANPTLNIDELSTFELASARLDDEERRRTELFGEKLELEAERTGLEERLQTVESKLDADGPLNEELRRAVATFRSLETYF